MVAGASPHLGRPICLVWRLLLRQGMHQRGGKVAEEAEEVVRTLLLDKQQPDGAWNSSSGEEQNAGKVYCTALAILSLSVKYHFLPIYQR